MREHLGFADDAFDVVIAQFVITVVPDPEATLDEFVRVTRPGGDIILVNHLGAEEGLRTVVRGMVRAGRAAARLAAGISLGPHRAMGRAQRSGHIDRATPDAAARTVFHDPIPAGRAKRDSASGRGAGERLTLGVVKISGP